MMITARLRAKYQQPPYRPTRRQVYVCQHALRAGAQHAPANCSSLDHMLMGQTLLISCLVRNTGTPRTTSLATA